MQQDSAAGNKREENPQTLLNGRESPVLLMQAEPRQVVTANAEACALFAKDLAKIEGHRGGQVFDCLHSFSEAGCGKDPNCENCKIKAAVLETFASGQARAGIETVLDIKKQNAVIPYAMRVATEKTGDFVLLTIERYEKKT
ncbi:hypothetical protein ACUUL3_07955 [Thiovibrio sp. JS02]